MDKKVVEEGVAKNNNKLDKKRNIDNYHRDEFIADALNIINTLAEKQKSVTFAIQGSWGVGKTWILDNLDMILEKKYIVIRYNAWENDFYDEPFEAILSVIADKLNDLLSVTNTIEDLLVKAIKSSLSAIAEVTGEISKNKFGVNVVEEGKRISKYVIKAKKCQEIDTSFDTNKTLTKLKKQVKNSLEKISQYKTIIIMVDELDRCLPNYAIKVLERIHHLFSKTKNLQVVVAVDDKQLTNTIKDIFGEMIDIQRYLNKFFDFKITLKNGAVGNNFDNLYPWYCKCFVNSEFSKVDDIDLLKSQIFEVTKGPYDEKKDLQLNAREIENLINKAYMLHCMLCDTEKIDYIYFGMEIISVVLNEVIIKQRLGKLYNEDISSTNSDYVLQRNIPCYENTINRVSSSVLYEGEKAYDVTCFWGIIWYVFARTVGSKDAQINENIVREYIDEKLYGKSNNVEFIKKEDKQYNKKFKKEQDKLIEKLVKYEQYLAKLVDWINIID